MSSTRPSLTRTHLLTRNPPKPIHPARAHIYVASTPGERAADLIASFAGSWLFVFIHVVWFALWLLLHLDINLLTLIVSLEAIFLATFVLMTQNRQASKDKSRDDLEASEVGQLFTINQRQLEILEILHALRAEGGETPAGQPSSAPVSLETLGDLSSSH
jgi:uncharacterized membrane protein